MHIDRGDAWVEVGLRVPDWPEITIRYSHEFRFGQKDSTVWGDTNLTGLASPFNSTRKIVPSFRDIDETRDIVSLEISKTIGNTDVLLGMRYEHNENDYSLNMQWLTDVLFNALIADQYSVFVVQNAEVLGIFGWEQSDRKYFSFAEFTPFLRQIDEQGAQSDKLEAVQRSAYQSAILNLRNGLALYQRLKNSIQPEGTQNFAAELQSFESSVPGAAKAARKLENGENFDKAKLDDVAELIQHYEKLSEMAYILAVPPHDP